MDEARQEFVRINSVALVAERDAKIHRQSRHISALLKAKESLRRELRACRCRVAYLEAVRDQGGDDGFKQWLDRHAGD